MEFKDRADSLMQSAMKRGAVLLSDGSGGRW